MKMPASWIFLILTIALNAGGGLLLKLATGSQGWAKLIMTGASLGCYGFGFLTFYTSLRRLPVSIAYPAMTGGAILTVVLSAALILGEGLTKSKILGAILVVCGEMLLLRSSDALR